MKENKKEGNIGEDYLFHHLLAMFQTMAIQQLGKLMNPITGKLERDLHQARITIDMIGMIQKKTDGNLTDQEKRLIDNILAELQLNYVDELEHSEEEPRPEAEDAEKLHEKKEDIEASEKDQPADEEQAEDKPEK